VDNKYYIRFTIICAWVFSLTIFYVCAYLLKLVCIKLIMRKKSDPKLFSWSSVLRLKTEHGWFFWMI